MTRQRVLLAHGNADCQRIYGSVLGFAGYDVVIVGDMESALARLAAEHYDVIVSDLYLASADDECLLRVVRSSTVTSHLPVVIITGWTTQPHYQLALDLFADRFLPLPIRPRDLTRIVGELLGRDDRPALSSTRRDEPEGRPLANGR